MTRGAPEVSVCDFYHGDQNINLEKFYVERDLDTTIERPQQVNAASPLIEPLQKGRGGFEILLPF